MSIQAARKVPEECNIDDEPDTGMAIISQMKPTNQYNSHHHNKARMSEKDYFDTDEGDEGGSAILNQRMGSTSGSSSHRMIPGRSTQGRPTMSDFEGGSATPSDYMSRSRSKRFIDQVPLSPDIRKTVDDVLWKRSKRRISDLRATVNSELNDSSEIPQSMADNGGVAILELEDLKQRKDRAVTPEIISQASGDIKLIQAFGALQAECDAVKRDNENIERHLHILRTAKNSEIQFGKDYLGSIPMIVQSLNQRKSQLKQQSSSAAQEALQKNHAITNLLDTNNQLENKIRVLESKQVFYNTAVSALPAVTNEIARLKSQDPSRSISSLIDQNLLLSTVAYQTSLCMANDEEDIRLAAYAKELEQRVFK